MSVDVHKETLEFQTEAKQLLQLMIHSLYSNKEIFLRELISNASDACDKLRFEALGDDALYEGDSELQVVVSFNKQAGTLTIRDNGIGMSRQEVIDNIGTIARSGTRQFFEKLSGDQAKDAQLIGQFGVGFYSAFIVAERVELTTRRAGLSAEHAVRWESSGEGSYTLEVAHKATRGTEITLHLRADERELLEDYRLRGIVRRYSDSIALPIMMAKQDAEGQAADGGLERIKLERINQASALWKRARNDISEQEYQDFYKHLSHDFEGPLVHTHAHVEGRQSYSSLFFLPSRAPFDLWDRDKRHGVKLYVRRVFIMDAAEELIPNYLRFVRGIIDSDDLPLNVSREILQHNRQIEVMRGSSVKKILDMIEDLAKNDAAKYRTFWEQCGKVLKEGVVEDMANQQRICQLLRFDSTHDSSGERVSLQDYIARMKPGQDKIYYISAETLAAARSSPHLEVFRKKDIEVLLMHDRVDEWMMGYLFEFDGKSLQSVAKGSLELGALDDQEEKQKFEQVADEFKGLVERIKTALGEQVKEVRVTHRLTDSPSCVVVGEHDMAINLQKLLKAAGQQVPEATPTLEINPHHPLVRNLKQLDDETRIRDWSQLLFDQALLSEGGQLQDPAAFVKRTNELLLALMLQGR
ncbi:MAG: molecular chaperone HtpG [Gammaproteobacteria bacterium]|nr:molecular chaperone HtpG [Gammaproteobacteria bacterium]